jgi:hypothetical protein
MWFESTGGGDRGWHEEELREQVFILPYNDGVRPRMSLSETLAHHMASITDHQIQAHLSSPSPSEHVGSAHVAFAQTTDLFLFRFIYPVHLPTPATSTSLIEKVVDILRWLFHRERKYFKVAASTFRCG